MSDGAKDDRVSRRRYEREKAARAEAELLLEKKSSELYFANEELALHSAQLEAAVEARTRDLSDALARAEAASTARSRFLATMSHEIRTPLGGLLGMVDLLAMDEKDPEKLELLNFARGTGQSLSRIVNEVLDFSKMEAGVFMFEEERVDLRALIQSIRMLVGSQQEIGQRRLSVRVTDDVPKLFLSDATRIRQVISNLVNNALRYSTEGPILLRATVAGSDSQPRLRMEVEDFGIGVAPDQIENLFKDFSQISNPLTAAAQGTGLGLAICKRIIEGLGGTISVQSVLHDGSVFWFELPLRPIDEAQAEALDTQDDAPPPQTQTLAGRRVLIAEDNIVNQKLLLAYADNLGLEADLAENGRVALERFTPGRYDLVLMDIAMPEMDGLEATRRLRAKYSADELPPILALTAHVMDEIEAEALQAGVDKVLPKPIPFASLEAALKAALRGRRRAADPSRSPSSTSAKPQDTPTPETSSCAGAALADLMDTEIYESYLDIFGPQGLSEFAVKFVVDSTERLAKLQVAHSEGDMAATRAEAHSLKGAAMTFGFPEMAEMARQIELDEIAAHGTTIDALVVGMQTKFDMIRAAVTT